MDKSHLSKADCDTLRKYIHSLCGLHIQEDKHYLILQRLEEVVSQSGCKDYSEFCRKLATAPTPDLHEKIIAAITTNETSFFRDHHPYEALSGHLLPSMAERLRRRKAAAKDGPPHRARIWSAGASTGQEPYSLAMTIAEFIHAGRAPGLALEDFHIFATDISARVLAIAQAGRYTDMDTARGLPPSLRDRYFTREDKAWRVADAIRHVVEFRRLNLTEPFSLFVTFDAILCRNVLIYFDDATKRSIVEGFHRRLDDDGILILGAAENLYSITDKFESVRIGETIVYRKKR